MQEDHVTRLRDVPTGQLHDQLEEMRDKLPAHQFATQSARIMKELERRGGNSSSRPRYALT